MKGAFAESRKDKPDAETNLIFISPRFKHDMMVRFWSSSRTRFRDLGFVFRVFVLTPRPVGGVLYFIFPPSLFHPFFWQSA